MCVCVCGGGGGGGGVGVEAHIMQFNLIMFASHLVIKDFSTTSSSLNLLFECR